MSFWGLIFGIVWQDYNGNLGQGKGDGEMCSSFKTFAFSYFLPAASLFQDQMQMFYYVAQNTQFIRGCVDSLSLKYVGGEQTTSRNELRV